MDVAKSGGVKGRGGDEEEEVVGVVGESGDRRES